MGCGAGGFGDLHAVAALVAAVSLLGRTRPPTGPATLVTPVAGSHSSR
ncbi:hypothetical protein [Streptomyces sp. NBC_00989]|nr:hypothetical protein OG714_35530 [Streptomyces sp. NBC_00989]